MNMLDVVARDPIHAMGKPGLEWILCVALHWTNVADVPAPPPATFGSALL
jgi:hypothetical protein